MNRVLLLTDFSKNANEAVDFAFQLWKGRSCKFFILNIQKTSEFTTDDLITAKPHESIFASIIADNKAKINAYIETLKDKVSNEDFELIAKVDYDVFSDAVKQAVSTYDIDYIVMGTNGISGASEQIFGSNTMQVIRNVSCPTIVVPEGFSFRPLKEVLYTQTEKFCPTKAELAPVVALLGDRASRMHLLAIHPPEARDLESLEKTLAELENDPFGDIVTQVETLEDLPVPQAINAYQQLNEVDLHVFLVQKESFLKRFLFGSNAGQVSHRTRVPLLVLHHK